MKIGRNTPCPCGSGRKYKKCCMLKERIKAAEEKLELQSMQYDDEDNEFDDQALMSQFIQNMHKFFLEKKPHIKEYKSIRKLHSEIASGMMDYFYKGKFEQKIDTDYVPEYRATNKKEGDTLVLMESDFDMETSVGRQAFVDMLLYKLSPNLNCITEEFINKNRYRKPEKIEFLQSMLDSKLGLFEITDTDIEEGYAYINEVFTGSEYKITDMGLSRSGCFNDYYIYTRIITYHGISFGTGLIFIFKKQDPFIKDFIKRQKEDYTPDGDLFRFIELYNRFSKDMNGIKFSLDTVK